MMNSILALSKNSLWYGLGLFWVLVIIAATTAPWSNFEPTPVNCSRINWLPYSYVGLKIGHMKDIVQNLLLYIPFGYFVAKGFQSANRVSLVTVLLWAGVLSVTTEFAQIFQPERYPSATDVVNNMVGALMGASLASRWIGNTIGSKTLLEGRDRSGP